MHTIRTRIMALTMAAILVSMLTLGPIAFFSVRRASAKSSAEIMRLICDERKQTISDYLNGIEATQDIVSQFALSEISIATLSECNVVGADGADTALILPAGSREQRRLDEYLHTYVDRVEDVFQSAASGNAGIAGCYFGVNPQFSEKERGFSYTRLSSISLGMTELPDLRSYDADDFSHVGWYYTPLESGKPVWLDPYDNASLGVKTISYVSPVYKGRTFVGVLGVDIRYKTLVDMIRNIEVYRTGYAFLMQPDGTILYHPTLEAGTNLAPDNRDLAAAVEMMNTMDSNTEPIRYRLDGENRQMFYTRLNSGQILAVTAPEREINENWRLLAYRLLAVSIALLSVFAAVTIATVRRITLPLQKLTEASRAISGGNYNVQLEGGGMDEVGMLTSAFTQLVEHMKVYISDLNSMAYRDALTGVKNKAAYDISAQKLNDMIRMGGKDDPPEFALIMLDCNDLKKINDTYGHEKGDVYLRTACKLICDVFPHSPVFRVGGDEFSVILHEQPYDERDRLMDDFGRRMAELNAKVENPWERASIAVGLAAYDPAADADVDAVLKRADALMYENKRAVKKKLAEEAARAAENDFHGAMYE